MKKIMFNDKYGLTEAVLNGRKTQTRRIANLTKHQFELLTGMHPNAPKLLIQSVLKDSSKYSIDEIVAVAQAYKNFYNDEYNPLLFPAGAGVLNKMFVKPELMPHQIRITDIRVERLQDISDEDCLREGIWKAENVGFKGITYWYPNLVNSTFRTPREAFASLIDKVSGKGTWDSNPYVFVYDFELVK